MLAGHYYLQTMNRWTVLRFFAIPLLIAGCVKHPGGRVEHCFNLPDQMGTLSIELDTNLSQAASWKHSSDYKCGAEWVEGLAFAHWPLHCDEDYFSPLPDSVFQFTMRYPFYDPIECGSPLDVGNERAAVQEWLTQYVHTRQIENTTWKPVDYGVLEVGGLPWGFIQTSRINDMHNDQFQCFTHIQGRNVSLLWQRVAPSAVPFDFGSYARQQLETVRFR